MTKQKLELTWVSKDIRPRLEPRVLLPVPENSYTAQARVTDHDLSDNCLIFGDNLLALKALESELTGKVKCRPALRHWQRFRALRRRLRTQPMAKHNARQARVAMNQAEPRREYLELHQFPMPLAGTDTSWDDKTDVLLKTQMQQSKRFIFVRISIITGNSV